MTDWKYFIRDSSVAPLENEYFEWARKEFGSINYTRWNANFQGYWFNDEKDYKLFLDTWGTHPNFNN